VRSAAIPFVGTPDHVAEELLCSAARHPRHRLLDEYYLDELPFFATMVCRGLRRWACGRAEISLKFRRGGLFSTDN